MAEPRYDLTAVRAVPLAGGGYAHVVWNAVIVDSTGREFRHGKGYRLDAAVADDPSIGAHSPEAAALLAAARTDVDVMVAVDADARRALAEIEARVTGGAVEAPAVVLFAAPVPVHAPAADDAEPVSDPFPATPEPIED